MKFLYGSKIYTTQTYGNINQWLMRIAGEVQGEQRNKPFRNSEGQTWFAANRP